MNDIAAIGFSLLAAFAVLFQIALVVGAPWGELTLGGKFPGKLSASLRLVAAVSGCLLTFFALVVLAKAGLILAEWTNMSKRMIWIVVGYCVLGVIANAATPSRRERMLWLPVVTAMLALSVVVAVG
jgi:hypothetical protein